MSFIIVYVTHKNEKDAEKIVSHILSKKLIACANIFPIKSSYSRTGKIVKAKEVTTILKTRKENWMKLKKEIEKMHPYTVPCIIKIPVSANKSYEDWIREVTI